MDRELMDKCLLTEEETDKLWEKYEEEDPYQETDWGGILIKAQLLKAYPIIKRVVRKEMKQEGYKYYIIPSVADMLGDR